MVLPQVEFTHDQLRKARQLSDGRVEILVHWAFMDPVLDTWEPVDSLPAQCAGTLTSARVQELLAELVASDDLVNEYEDIADVFAVEKLLFAVVDKDTKKTFVFIKWEHYPIAEATWEPVDHIINYSSMAAEIYAARRRSAKLFFKDKTLPNQKSVKDSVVSHRPDKSESRILRGTSENKVLCTREMKPSRFKRFTYTSDTDNVPIEIQKITNRCRRLHRSRSSSSDSSACTTAARPLGGRKKRPAIYDSPQTRDSACSPCEQQNNIHCSVASKPVVNKSRCDILQTKKHKKAVQEYQSKKITQIDSTVNNVPNTENVTNTPDTGILITDVLGPGLKLGDPCTVQIVKRLLNAFQRDETITSGDDETSAYEIMLHKIKLLLKEVEENIGLETSDVIKNPNCNVNQLDFPNKMNYEVEPEEVNDTLHSNTIVVASKEKLSLPIRRNSILPEEKEEVLVLPPENVLNMCDKQVVSLPNDPTPYVQVNTIAGIENNQVVPLRNNTVALAQQNTSSAVESINTLSLYNDIIRPAQNERNSSLKDAGITSGIEHSIETAQNSTIRSITDIATFSSQIVSCISDEVNGSILEPANASVQKSTLPSVCNEMVASTTNAHLEDNEKQCPHSKSSTLYHLSFDTNKEKQHAITLVCEQQTFDDTNAVEMVRRELDAVREHLKKELKAQEERHASLRFSLEQLVASQGSSISTFNGLGNRQSIGKLQTALNNENKNVPVSVGNSFPPTHPNPIQVQTRPPLYTNLESVHYSPPVIHSISQSCPPIQPVVSQLYLSQSPITSLQVHDVSYSNQWQDYRSSTPPLPHSLRNWDMNHSHVSQQQQLQFQQQQESQHHQQQQVQQRFQQQQQSKPQQQQQQQHPQLQFRQQSQQHVSSQAHDERVTELGSSSIEQTPLSQPIQHSCTSLPPMFRPQSINLHNDSFWTNTIYSTPSDTSSNLKNNGTITSQPLVSSSSCNFHTVHSQSSSYTPMLASYQPIHSTSSSGNVPYFIPRTECVETVSHLKHSSIQSEGIRPVLTPISHTTQLPLASSISPSPIQFQLVRPPLPSIKTLHLTSSYQSIPALQPKMIYHCGVPIPEPVSLGSFRSKSSQLIYNIGIERPPFDGSNAAPMRCYCTHTEASLPTDMKVLSNHLLEHFPKVLLRGIKCNICTRREHVACSFSWYNEKFKEKDVLDYIKNYVCIPCRLILLDPLYPIDKVLELRLILPPVNNGEQELKKTVELQFRLNQQEIQALSNETMCLQIRSIEMTPTTYRYSGFPREMSFKVNPVSKTSPPLIILKPPGLHRKRREEPQMISCNTFLCDINRIILDCIYKPPHLSTYLFAAVLVHKQPIQDLLKQTITNNWISPLLSRQLCRAVTNYCSNTSTNDEEIVIESKDISLTSLRCPSTLMRIELPGRGFHCMHIQCFDIAFYIPSQMRIGSHKNRWKCPVCFRPCYPHEIILDQFFKEILDNTSELDRTVFLVFKNDSITWRVTEKDEPESDEVIGDNYNNNTSQQLHQLIASPKSKINSPHSINSQIILKTMPKYYCEYCDIYLTHSSPGGRRQHNAGRKHINNKIDYFLNLIRDLNFTPPQHIMEMTSGALGNMSMMIGGRPGHNPCGPAILRPPPMTQMPPWGGPMIMGCGMPPMNPMGGLPPMMSVGRGAPTFMMPPAAPPYRPRPF